MPSYALYSGTTFKIPQDCVAITIECIGAGGASTGAAYSKTNRISVSRGQTIYINVGSAGGNTWVNVNSNSQPSTTSDGCLALGGNTAASSQIAGGVGDVKYRGGSAGGLSGGGAAGPAGNGGDGRFSSPYYIGGSANNGGASANTTNPATLTLGVLSQFGVDYASRSYGSYSGGPAWDDGGGGGTSQGMGGGGAAQSYVSGPGGGLVVISFSSYPVSGTYSEQFFVNDNSRSPFRFPKCTITVNRILGVGAGSTGYGGIPANGGGGGGYAASSYNLNTKRNLLMYYNVAPASSSYYGSTSNTWANLVANREPANGGEGIRAGSAYQKYYGGYYCFTTNIGNSVTYIGGYGGCGVQVSSASRRGGGGGAAGGPYGSGGYGGNGYNITSSTASGAGGGGGGVNYYSGLNAAGNGTSSAGGRGGYSAQGTPGAGGSNGATTTGGGAGSNGGGGGGAGYRASTFLQGGAGSSAFYTGWNIYFGSGGGGGGSNTTTSGGQGGVGGSYGGGGGGGCNGGAGTSGAICIQYTVAVRGSLHGFFT